MAQSEYPAKEQANEPATRKLAIPRWKLPWFALACVCLGIVAFKIVWPEGESSNISYLAGLYLISAVATWLLFLALVRSMRRARYSIFALLCIWASIVIGEAVAHQLALHALIGNSKNFVQVLNHLIEAGKENPDPMKLPSGVKLESESADGTLPGLLNSIVTRSTSSASHYEMDLEAAGWQKILDEGRLRADSSGAGTLKLTSDAIIALARHRARMLAIYDSMESDVRSLQMPDKEQNQVLSGMNTSKSKRELSEMMDLEQSLIETMSRMAQYLQLRKGHWSITNDHLVFTNQRDIDAYSSLIQEVEVAQAQQARYRSEAGRTIEGTVNSLKEALAQ